MNSNFICLRDRVVLLKLTLGFLTTYITVHVPNTYHVCRINFQTLYSKVKTP